MATSKTLKPTNTSISIPALSDAPDMSVPADAIDKEADAINALWDGRVFYGTSSTGASTQEKIVSITGFPTTLTAGLMVRIKFSNNQTYNGQPTLKINSLSAVNVVRYGTTAAARYEWIAGQVVDFVYDGTNFVMVDGGIATTTYYGRTKLSDSLTSTSITLAATANAAKQLNDGISSLQNSLYKMVGQTYVNNNSSFNIGLNSLSAAFLFYRSYQPNILYITENGTVTVVAGKNEAITVTASGSVLTITNTIGWGLAFAWIKTGNPPA